MEINDLTDEQMAKLTPEQVTILEDDPSKLDEIIGQQTAETEDEPEQAEEEGAANGAGEEEAEPVVLNKSGKEVIPYAKHKELRVENATLREQLQAAQQENSKAAEELSALLKAKDDAKGKDVAVIDDALEAHLTTIKEDMPELYAVINQILDGTRKQEAKLTQTLDQLKREKEESERAKNQSIDEQVAEAIENNPILSHWKESDPDAWDEAIRQDEAIRYTPKWSKKSFDERFDEIVRRVQKIIPDATLPAKKPTADDTKAAAKAKLEKAPARKPTTLSDVQGGADPTSEQEQIANLSPHELTARLMKMPAHKAAAMRAELD